MAGLGQCTRDAKRCLCSRVTVGVNSIVRDYELDR
jgi:hypothetical protein